MLCLQCRLLMAFKNNLDQDQTQQNVGPDLDPNCLQLILYLIFEKKILKKSIRQQKSIRNYPVGKDSILNLNIPFGYSKVL